MESTDGRGSTTMDKAKILIVDDTQANIEMLNETLENEFDIYFAADGNDALQKVQLLEPDLILLDIMMPVMDGFEVCRKLKENEQFRDIPVIFITALDQAEDESKGLVLGAADYVTKPFNPDIVLLRVRNHLKLKNQRDTLELRTLELEKILSEIKVLQGIIPICAYCKNIRDDQGYWNQVEKYVSEHTEAKFSHGICPTCFENEMKELES